MPRSSTGRFLEPRQTGKRKLDRIVEKFGTASEHHSIMDDHDGLISARRLHIPMHMYRPPCHVDKML